jgi:tRNA(adenine34) deaminase
MNYEHYMRTALELAEQALAKGEFPVGCVISYQGKIITSAARKNTQGDVKNELDHAEMVALRRLSELGQDIDISQLIVFCTMEPCLMCLGALILNGVRKIVYAYEDVMGGGTSCELTSLKPLYRNNRITIVADILRNESLQLFKTFFTDPNNNYWKDSLLAQYTLRQ